VQQHNLVEMFSLDFITAIIFVIVSFQFFIHPWRVALIECVEFAAKYFAATLVTNDDIKPWEFALAVTMLVTRKNKFVLLGLCTLTVVMSYIVKNITTPHITTFVTTTVTIVALHISQHFTK
jgi:hypothetical protein